MSIDYQLAAKALSAALNGKTSVRNAIYGTCKQADGSMHRSVSRVYAIVDNLHKRIKLVDAIIDGMPSLSKSTDDRCLLRVLVWEQCGKGINGGGALKRTVESHKEQIQEAAKALKLMAKTEPKPASARFVRVNTLLTTTSYAVAVLCDSSRPAHLSESEVEVDKHVHNLLRLPPTAHSRLQLHDHELLKSGKLVLQDKASCFTVQALFEDLLRGDFSSYSAQQLRQRLQRDKKVHAIDACAAPGNKTSQLASFLAETAAALPPTSKEGAHSGVKRNRAKLGEGSAARKLCVFACERDDKRCRLLHSRLVTCCGDKYTVAGPDDAAGSDAFVEVKELDFLTLDTSSPEYADVTMAVVDPSCSGSGMLAKGAGVGGAIRYDAPAGQMDRVNSLAAFQKEAVFKALSFPAMLRVAYSTCSLYKQEDEEVVRDVITEWNNQAATRWRAAGEPSVHSEHLVKLLPALSEWPRRGIEGVLTPDQTAACARVDPRLHDKDTDEPNLCGFFVAVFEKVPATKSALLDVLKVNEASALVAKQAAATTPVPHPAPPAKSTKPALASKDRKGPTAGSKPPPPKRARGAFSAILAE